MASEPRSPARPGTAPPEDARRDRAARLAASLDRARGGDGDALGDVVRELNPLLWHVARAQGLGRDAAADVVQTTWLELVRRLDQIRSPQALTAWLVTTTRRQAWHVRAGQRRESGEEPDELVDVGDGSPDVPDLVAAEERHRLLWRHVHRLSERCRALLRVVAFVERPDYTVIAEALGMPHGSIGPTRGRCLAKLRDMLLADPAWTWP
jgi:RNA polymerase sigma factor (sigma-70 family)